MSEVLVDGVFSEQELAALRRAMYRWYGQAPPELDEHKVMEWCRKARIEAALLDLAIKGKVCIGVIDGEVAVRFPNTPLPRP